MSVRHFISILFFVSISTIVFAQKDNRMIRQGNKDFEKQDYTAAETDYLKALDANPKSMPASYNLGATRYRQDSIKQAVQNWSATALNPENSADMRSQSFYNIGNSMMRAEDYQKSIEAYKQALRLNPNDEDARYNLAYAQQKLKQQQQDQQNQQQKNDKNNQNQDQQQDQQDQQNQQDQQQQQSQQQDQQQQQQSQQTQQQEISKEEAERMLEAMKNNEKKTLEKVKQQQVGKPQKTDKDW